MEKPADNPAPVLCRLPPAEPAATPAPAPLPRLAYSVHETALLLGISDKSIRRLIARGLLRPSKSLRHLVISKKEIERFLDETSR